MKLPTAGGWLRPAVVARHRHQQPLVEQVVEVEPAAVERAVRRGADHGDVRVTGIGLG
jgi:hypothetical protein